MPQYWKQKSKIVSEKGFMVFVILEFRHKVSLPTNLQSALRVWNTVRIDTS